MATNHEKYVLAIDCGGTFVKTGIINANGEIKEKESFKTRLDGGLEVFLNDFQNLIAKHHSHIDAIGISFAAPLDADKGIIGEPPNFPHEWHNLALVDVLSKRCKLPVFMENDAKLAALGEYWKGEDNKVDILVVITLGTGVGGGIIINGKIWKGASGIAGEIGHISLADDGPKCGCGNIGCLETYASSTAVVRMTRETLKNPGVKTSLSSLKGEITALEVYNAAIAGDVEAQKIFAKVGRYLGKGIAAICHTIGPRKIVLTGGGAGAWSMFHTSMDAILKQMCFQQEAKILQVAPSKLMDSGILGAAYFTFQKLGTVNQ